MPREELADYLLSPIHTIGRSKAAFFRALGYADTRPEEFTRGVEIPAASGKGELARHGLVQGVNSPSGMPGSARKESWFKSMKSGLDHRWRFSTNGSQRTAIRPYIALHDEIRLHWSPHYRSPAEFEQA